MGSACPFYIKGIEGEDGKRHLQLFLFATGIIIYDENAMHNIRRRCAENLEKETCKDCKYVYNCAGGCMGQVVNETGDIMGRIEDNCKIVQYLGERIERNKGLFPAFHS